MDEAEEVHASLAARLVLAPRATRVPAPPAEETDETPPLTEAQESTPDEDDTQDTPPPDARQDETNSAEEEEAPGALDDRLIEAVRAAIPPGLLAALQMGQARQARAAAAGRSGELMKNQNRGRPVGTRRAEPRSGARLHILETLRAAAPWQRLRQQQADGPKRIQVRREDFHVVRFRQRRPTTTLFVVDASGSAALHRLAEAKGAVELLLAECYVRRDKVAVLAFRGEGCELLLPPTRSLARAKRSLAALPGGGGTPLAAGIEAARELAQQIGRQGETPVVVMLTDGRANVARDGGHGRARATDDALQAADAFRLARATPRAPWPSAWAPPACRCRTRARPACRRPCGWRVCPAPADHLPMTQGLDWQRDGPHWPHHDLSSFVWASGLQWHVQRFAGPEGAPCLVLLHGTGASTHSWRDLAPLLAQRFEVVTMDLPGHAFTGMPPGGVGSPQLSLPGMARAVHGLLQTLTISPAMLVGHSAGAAVAVRMCLDGLATPRSVLGLNAALMPLGGLAGRLFSPVAKLMASAPLCCSACC